MQSIGKPWVAHTPVPRPEPFQKIEGIGCPCQWRAQCASRIWGRRSAFDAILEQLQHGFSSEPPIFSALTVELIEAKPEATRTQSDFFHFRGVRMQRRPARGAPSARSRLRLPLGTPGLALRTHGLHVDGLPLGQAGCGQISAAKSNRESINELLVSFSPL